MKQITAEILVVGNELLNGTTLDTNSHWLSGRLVRLGINVARKTTVPDSLRIISSAFRELMDRRPNWIFSIGGLGPTYDDMTLEGLARSLARRTWRDPIAVRYLAESQARRLGAKRRRPSLASLKMATIPEGSIPLKNPAGSASAVLLVRGSSTIVSLPGVPSELKAIFLQHLSPVLESSKVRFRRRETWLDVVGIGESSLSGDVKKIAAKYAPEIYIKSHPMGFRRGASLLNIQLIETAAPAAESNTPAPDRLSVAIDEVCRVVERLGGSVKRRTIQ